MKWVTKRVMGGIESVGCISPSLKAAQAYARQLTGAYRIYESAKPLCLYVSLGKNHAGLDILGLALTVGQQVDRKDEAAA